MSRTSPSQSSSRATILTQATIEASSHSIGPQENYVEQFLAKHPDYRKALWLAARSEEEGLANPVISGLAMERHRDAPHKGPEAGNRGNCQDKPENQRATYYLLKEPELVKTVLKGSVLKK